MEALVEPITEILNRPLNQGPHLGNNQREIQTKKYEVELQQYNHTIIQNPARTKYIHKPQKNSDLEKEEIYVTLIGILKKQDQRIKELEKKILVLLMKNF